MNQIEFALLEAMNMATTEHMRHGHFEATAEQIAEEVNGPDYPGVQLNTRQVARHLVSLGNRDLGRPPLVAHDDRSPRRYWLTDAALKVMSA